MVSKITKTALFIQIMLFISFSLHGQLKSSLAAKDSTSNKFDSYRGLVMTGYQGWFNTPTDGANKGWTHWKKDSKFEPGYCTIDFWPEMDEYPKKYATSFKFPNGDTAYVFSSYDSSTIDLHFKWMEQYGIDGAFMQRFSQSLTDPYVKNHYHVVFDAAMKAAKKYNRAITIRYDITEISSPNSAILLADLDQMRAKYHNFDREHNPTFLYHNGKPLIAFGGVGFRSNLGAGGTDPGNLEEAKKMIAGFRQRGFSVLMRVPARWRDFSGTAVVETKAQQDTLWKIIKSVDMIMPWHVGAYKEDSYSSWPQVFKDDMTWCTANNIEYVPVIFPGFSRANLKDDEAEVDIPKSFRPRNKGTFYWLQAQSVIGIGAKMIFQAQFDEVDEGTQVFKCVKVAPVNPLIVNQSYPFITYEEDIESDHYMWLVGKSAQMLRGEIPFSTRMPYRIPVTEVSVSPTSATLFVNDTQQLTATVTPSNAINKTVTWSSNNPTTASVSTSGLITAKAAGTALITVTTYDGYKTASVDITVIDTTTSIVDYTLLEKGFNIYPNPSKGSFNVVIPGSYKHADYQVINFIGNIISVGKFNSNSPIINLKGISKGYYILKINTGIQMYFHKIQIE